MQSYDKDSVCNFLKKLSNDIAFHLEEMKADFQKNPPSVNIKERFMQWKQKHQDSLNNCLQAYILRGDVDPATFSFKDFLDRVTEEYQNDQDFMDLLKNTNSNIENLKEFIRTNLAKDPSIYVIKDI